MILNLSSSFCFSNLLEALLFYRYANWWFSICQLKKYVFTGYTMDIPTTYFVIHLLKNWLFQNWNYMTLPCEATVKYIFSWYKLIYLFEHPCIKALTIKPMYKQMLNRCTRNSGAEFEKWVALFNRFPSFFSSSDAPSGYNLNSTKIKKRKMLLYGKYITRAICSSYM